MWIKLDTNKLWGRPIQYDNYKRIDISLNKGLVDGIVNKENANFEASTKRLSYANGLFYIFKTKSKKIKIKYKYHHSNKHDFYFSRQAIVEPQLCGKLENGDWIMLNKMHTTDKFFPDCAEKEYTITYAFSEDFNEFQLCLPYGSVFYYIYIDSDKPLSLIDPLNVKFGFLGSSITSFIGTFASCSLPSQIYRKLNINVCNLAIPMTNTLCYDSIISFIDTHPNIIWYLGDIMHLSKKALERGLAHNIKTACINARVSEEYKSDKINYIFNFTDPTYNRDHLHLTSAGTVAYVNQLIPILKEDLINEKFSNN